MSRIDREALPAVLVSAVPSLVAGLAGRRRTALALAALPLGVAAFFRDPDRRPDAAGPGDLGDPDVVLSPADGKVMYAGPGQPEVAPEGDWQQISIFLSVFDVHINRMPYGGRITRRSYQPGKWLAAYKHESAYLNERSDLVVEQSVEGQTRRVHFRQIVGLLARRVVTRVSEGETVTAGQRMGLMKFGSRMDVFVPPEATLAVAKGDRVKAGESVLARWWRRGPQ